MPRRPKVTPPEKMVKGEVTYLTRLEIQEKTVIQTENISGVEIIDDKFTGEPKVAMLYYRNSTEKYENLFRSPIVSHGYECHYGVDLKELGTDECKLCKNAKNSSIHSFILPPEETRDEKKFNKKKDADLMIAEPLRILQIYDTPLGKYVDVEWKPLEIKKADFNRYSKHSKKKWHKSMIKQYRNKLKIWETCKKPETRDERSKRLSAENRVLLKKRLRLETVVINEDAEQNVLKHVENGAGKESLPIEESSKQKEISSSAVPFVSSQADTKAAVMPLDEDLSSCGNSDNHNGQETGNVTDTSVGSRSIPESSVIPSNEIPDVNLCNDSSNVQGANNSGNSSVGELQSVAEDAVILPNGSGDKISCGNSDSGIATSEDDENVIEFENSALSPNNLLVSGIVSSSEDPEVTGALHSVLDKLENDTSTVEDLDDQSTGNESALHVTEGDATGSEKVTDNETTVIEAEDNGDTIAESSKNGAVDAIEEDNSNNFDVDEPMDTETESDLVASAVFNVQRCQQPNENAPLQPVMQQPMEVDESPVKVNQTLTAPLDSSYMLFDNSISWEMVDFNQPMAVLVQINQDELDLENFSNELTSL